MLAGQYKGKEKKPTIVLEAWADHRRWIWQANFGSPGSLNDLNILDQSIVPDIFINGNKPHISFTVNGCE
ncbi:hypothetical protein THRCLA_22922 [Thraustotheca clavata]|uniref:Uncharacterized protein n=1 Tax=Thraustotheca clavata TaxID=74557 RepID=A0A1V9YNL7_9STRA|nr:hypothetical protein THRCLA_22922 [Thraustotheca clavata]